MTRCDHVGEARRRALALAGHTGRMSLAAALLWGASAGARAQTVTVSVDRSVAAPLAANFNGANIASPDTPVEFGDEAVRDFVRPLQPGALRWPGGTVNDFFLWQKGEIPAPAGSPTATTRSGVPTPIDILRSVFSPYPGIGFNGQVARATDELQPILAGKGGNPLGDRTTGFAGFAAALGARFVVVVNASTDTVDDAQALAARVASARLPVIGFELVNEPYFLQVPTSTGPITLPPNAPRVSGAYADGVDYLTKMKPYRDAIKRGFAGAGVDPARALVAIGGGYVADTSAFNVRWASDLSNYTQAHGAWWDAVAMHFYPTESKDGDFATKMAYANDGLLNGTDLFIGPYRSANWSRGKTLLITEYDVTLNDRGIEGSVFAGVFSAEYAARLSRYPETGVVELHELFSAGDGVGVPETAIDGDGSWHSKLKAAGRAGQVLDTTGRIQGLYYTAQILGVGLADAALNGSDQVFSTSVTGATGTVPTRSATMPAVFAQAYHGRDGALHVLATNKGKDPVTAQMVVDGRRVSTPLTVDRLAPTNGDPAQANDARSQRVAVVHGTAYGAVTLPGYSAAHIVFAAP